jgi:hypothetical protein
MSAGVRPGHPTSECRNKQKCPEEGCKYTHHHLLHKSSTRPVNTTAELSDEEDTSPADGKVNKVHTAATKSQVLLRVLPVALMGPKGNVEVHALCDEGSTVTLLEEDIADLLGLQGPHQSLCLQFLGKDGKKMENSRRVEVQIQGLQKNCKSFSLSNVRTVKGLGLSSQIVDVEQLKIQHQYLRSIPLPAMRAVTPVLLLGADHFRLITPRKVVEGTSTGPVATECLLGWSVGGDSRRRGKATSNPSYHLCESGDDELHRLVKESFTTENFGVKVTQSNIRSREDVRAEAILKETTKRIGHRYQTGLLWKSSNFILPESKSMAFMRLKCTERRMDKDASFAQQYNLKIAEYLTKGYVRKLSPEEAAVTTTRTFYLPHFGVTSPNKPGKFRLVFDAAAKAMGYSLNDFIVSGPDLLQPLPEVLHKFREGRIAFTGDIADMFHRVAVREEDQDSQRFLWRGMERHEEPDVYVMQVMTFGATCSPCSATFVKNLNAEENKEDFPKTWREVIESFYVDDYLGVADSEDGAAKKIADIIEINRRGNFNVTNWTCNSRAVLETIPLEQRSKELKSITPGADLPMERVLGLVWDPENDNFTFRLNFHKVKEDISSGSVTPTKREVLKLVMSIFDPLGFLSHFTMKAKVLLQSIWRSEVGWDDPITERQESVWRQWIAELQYITIVQIPRCYDVDYNKSEVQIHVFVDASEAAFSAVCYFRVSKADRVTTALVAAKSKVAPLKQLSIPRLELQGALLGTRLAASLTRGHRRTISRTVFWSDSKTVLCWLRSDKGRFKQFVSFRVGEILESTDPSQWRWVPSKENVADEATREDKRAEFNPNCRWMTGPDFLKLPEEDWPQEDRQKTDEGVSEDDLEFRPVHHQQLKKIEFPSLPDVKKYSSLTRLLRVTAWIQRYIHNLQQRMKKLPLRMGELLVSELVAAEKSWWKRSQLESFPEEVQLLQFGEDVPKSSKLWKLSPALDSDGVIVLRGRLDHFPATSTVPLEKKPVILDGHHLFTKLVVMDYHVRAGHAGREYVANELRQKFWIIGLRGLVKKTWMQCQFCRNRRAKAAAPEMGEIPLERLQQCSRPFIHTGMDYFGPIEVTVGRSRQKRYGALFTCMATRAVHIEIAHSLDTDSAIMAIRRFVSRRGAPEKLFSDNGTNFHGAERELREALEQIDQEKMLTELTQKKIDWKFIPPNSPHMGGVWERLVQSIKRALYSTLKETAPRDEVLHTLMCEAEHMVNSRPLTFVSSDPEDPEALTPNHFLVGRTSANQSPGEFDDADLILRRRWKISQRLSDHFWKRWLREYIPSLIKRSKWHSTTKPIQVGDVAILAEADGPRNSWPLGRVVATYPGKDGAVRVVDIKTSKGVYRRPVVKLIPLDVTEVGNP